MKKPDPNAIQLFSGDNELEWLKEIENLKDWNFIARESN